MENEITAHKAGKITELAVEVGASVSAGDALAVISAVDGQSG
jgi:biotin carboxyl carrier protein